MKQNQFQMSIDAQFLAWRVGKETCSTIRNQHCQANLSIGAYEDKSGEKNKKYGYLTLFVKKDTPY